MTQVQKDMKSINRTNEVNIIAYQIPGSDDIIIAKNNSDYYVKTTDGIMIYSVSEMEELYDLDIKKSNMERLTWPS